MKLLVIGGVAAGMSAASKARRVDPSLEIEVLEKGETVSYGACGIPYYFEGRVPSLDTLIVRTPEEFEKKGIHVRTGAAAAEIQHGRRQVLLEDGSTTRYDRLVIATGARPRLSGIRRADRPNFFALHTLHDAERLDAFLREKQPKRAVIVGASYLGLEMAEAFRTRGLAVTVVEAKRDVLGRHEPGLTKLVCERLERFGVSFRLETTVNEVTGDEIAGISCDVILAATGIEPNSAIAAAAGVTLGRTGAIAVNERMETNLYWVYAAGDCAEVNHLVTGRPVYRPLGTTANKQGRVAGTNAAGQRAMFRGIVGTGILRLFDLAIGATGFSAAQARQEGFDPVAATIESRDRPKYLGGRPTTVHLVADRRTRRLLGGHVAGERGVEGRINVIATAVTRGMSFNEVEDLDLAYAPPFAPTWDPVLVAAQQLARLLD